MKKLTRNPVAEAIESAMISPNVRDSNLEPANVVDVLHSVAQAVQHLAENAKEGCQSIATGLFSVAEALRQRKS